MLGDVKIRRKYLLFTKCIMPLTRAARADRDAGLPHEWPAPHTRERLVRRISDFIKDDVVGELDNNELRSALGAFGVNVIFPAGTREGTRIAAATKSIYQLRLMKLLVRELARQQEGGRKTKRRRHRRKKSRSGTLRR